MPCIDAKVERKAKPIDGSFDVLLIVNEQTTRLSVRCEKYYDAMCAARGNHWDMREVGATTTHQRSTLSLQDPSLGIIEASVPNCSSMVDGPLPPLEHTILSINGEPYWLLSSEHDMRTYSSGATAWKKSVSLRLDLSVNGISLEHESNDDA